MADAMMTNMVLEAREASERSAAQLDANRPVASLPINPNICTK